MISFLVVIAMNSLPDGFAGRAAFDRIVARIAPLRSQPIGAVMQAAAMELLGVPYAARTLDQNPGLEACTVTLDGLDCVTFFESVLGLARMVKAGGSTPEALMAEVTMTRYRGGVLDGYASRLHYTSDWIDDNEAKGIVRDITPSLPGAVSADRSFSFMSENPASYPALKADASLVSKIRQHEDALSRRPFWFVPKAKAADAERLLRPGDIIGMTVDGVIDISHTGMIVEHKGRIVFMHASSAKKMVIVDDQVSEYLKAQSRNTGFAAARPTEPAEG